jgi:hypothetical protein
MRSAQLFQNGFFRYSERGKSFSGNGVLARKTTNLDELRDIGRIDSPKDHFLPNAQR